MVTADRIRKVEAIVIRHTDYGEADRLLVLFTREMGKVRVIAKGVRKAHSRKAGHLEPFTCSILMLAKGTSFWIVSQAETVDAFLSMRENLTKTAQTAYALELLERFTSDEEANLALYRLIKEILIDINQEDDPFCILQYFQFRFLELVGFRPELLHCVQCRTEIQPEDQYFSALQGGVLCPRCGEKAQHARSVSMLTLKYMRHFQRSDSAQSKKTIIPADQRMELERLMQSYFAYLAERKLNAPDFLREIREPPLGNSRAIGQ